MPATAREAWRTEKPTRRHDVQARRSDGPVGLIVRRLLRLQFQAQSTHIINLLNKLKKSRNTTPSVVSICYFFTSLETQRKYN